MHDPFPAAPAVLSSLATTYLAVPLHLSTLPAHVHEVVFAFFFYHFVHLLSSLLSPRLLPRIYPRLPRRTRINWDLHVVSLVQSLLICTLAIYVLRNDQGIDKETWEGRIFGYSGAVGFVQAMAAGYFAWDVSTSIVWLDLMGIGALIHAICALLVAIMGFRPFGNYYGLAFVLYELSTPFLNFHWFFDKLGMTGSLAQLVNGIILITTFGACRLVWGVYQSYLIYTDMWQAIKARDRIQNRIGMTKIAAEVRNLPTSLVVLYLVGNTVLITLNYYWFGQMIKALMKRFKQPSPDSKRNGPKSVHKKKQ